MVHIGAVDGGSDPHIEARITALAFEFRYQPPKQVRVCRRRILGKGHAQDGAREYSIRRQDGCLIATHVT